MGYIIYSLILLLALWVWKRRTHSIQQKQYQPLSSEPGTFRVLELLSGHGDEMIEVRSHVATIDSAWNSYEALSYAWDKKPYTWKSISLDGAELPITQGLNQILVALRYHNASRRLWIDQICINQKDEDEKSSQMEMMRDIYGNASRTIIWLGQASKEDATVTSLLQICKPLRLQIQKLMEDDVKRLGTLEPAYHFAAHIGAISKHDTKYNVPIALRSLSLTTQHELLSFFRRRWFVRLWPLQEVIVSKKALVVRYGEQEADWIDIGFLAGYLMHSQVMDEVATHDRRGLEAANWVNFYWLHGKSEFPLIEMLRAARKYDANEANDKVFAVLGLSGEVQQLRKNGIVPLQSLRIKTNLDTATVYRRIANFFLERDHNLMVLSFVQHTGSTISSVYPSWVPDWSQQEIGTHLWIPGLIDEHAYDANPRSLHATSPSVSRTHSAAGLTVSGFILGRTDGGPLDLITQKDVDAIATGVNGSAQKLIRWILAMSQATLEEKMMVLTAGRMNARLITRNSLRNTKTPLLQYIGQFSAFVRDLTPEIVGTGLSLTETWKYEALRHAAAAEVAHVKRTGFYPLDGLGMKGAVLSACRERRLFFTTKGKWCLGPAACREGDLVCILDGGRVPFILREIPTMQAEEGYQLVGESYVSDFMFGEVNEIRPTLVRRRFPLF